MKFKKKYSLSVFLLIVITLISYPVIRNATAAEGMWTIIKNAFGGRGDVMTDTLTLRGAGGAGSTATTRNVVRDSTGVFRGYRYMVVTIGPTTATGTIDADADSSFVRQLSIRGWTDGTRSYMVGMRDLWRNQRVAKDPPKPLRRIDPVTGWISFYTPVQSDSLTRIVVADSVYVYPYFDIYSSGGSTTGHGAAFKVWVTGYND